MGAQVGLKVSVAQKKTAMRRVCLKNTFLTVEEDTAFVDLAASESPCSRRSKSEEPHCRRGLNETDDVLDIQLKTLNEIIESSKSSPRASAVASKAALEPSFHI